MGREQFIELWRHVSSMNVGPGPSQLYVHGTMGYGKSHILAALTCLLQRLGKRVVYMPDCRQMLTDVVNYVKSALLCAFSEPSLSPIRNEIRHLTGPDDILDFCRSLEGDPLYFIVDQINALEQAEPNTDKVPNKEKQNVSSFLEKLYLSHLSITSSSANNRTAVYMAKKQTGELKMQMMGGMSSVSLLHVCFV